MTTSRALGSARSHLLFLPLTGLVALGLAACGEDNTNPEPMDASVLADATSHPDATETHPDAAAADAAADAGFPDAAAMDAETTDAQSPDATGPRAIVFLHTNDEHSHEIGFGPEIDDYPTAAPTSDDQIMGGIKRRLQVIEDARAEANLTATPLALVSAGDMTMGSLFHIGNAAGPSAPAVDYALATLLQYDVITLGNHEFDFGVGTIAGALSTGGIMLPSGAPGILRIPVLTSNIRFSIDSASDDPLAALYAPQGSPTKPLRRLHVQTFGTGAQQVKVGFLGLMGLEAALLAPFKSPVHFSLPSTATACGHDAECPTGLCLPPGNDPTATHGFCAATTDETSQTAVMGQLVADAAAAVAELRAQGVDIVVAVTHAGVNDVELASLEQMNMGPENAMYSEDIVLAKGVDLALASQNIKGIDLIIGGHSHSVIPHPLAIPNSHSGITTWVTQAGSYGRAVGKVKLTQAGGGQPWTLDAASSGLTVVDAATRPSTSVTASTVDLVLGLVIAGLEGSVVSKAADGLIYPGEQCDTTPAGAPVLPNQGLCSGLIANSTGGMLACAANRQLDTSGCTMSYEGCGDGMRNLAEDCDGEDVGGVTCETLGYEAGGTLGCYANCTFDVSQCTPYFPSLLEIAVNFQQGGFPVKNDPNLPGDLFFYEVGSTYFDVPAPEPSHESNLINLVADAERYSLMQLSASPDPVRLVVQANGVLRDGIQLTSAARTSGSTGALSFEDLFRVVPLGVSPVENTPGYPVVDFYLHPEEIRRALEIGVNQGLQSPDFWLGISGAQVEYDPTLPAFDPAHPDTTGRITKITLTMDGADILDELYLEEGAIFDASFGAEAYPDPERLIHVGTNLYILLYAEQLGICPRDMDGIQFPQCQSCTSSSDCTAAAPRCDMTAQRCTGGNPVGFYTRSLVPINEYGLFQELKEFLALTYYVRSQGDGMAVLPENYSAPVPRRLCCVGNACPEDRVCSPGT